MVLVFIRCKVAFQRIFLILINGPNLWLTVLCRYQCFNGSDQLFLLKREY